jgi:hypothetical protein
MLHIATEQIKPISLFGDTRKYGLLEYFNLFVKKTRKRKC